MCHAESLDPARDKRSRSTIKYLCSSFGCPPNEKVIWHKLDLKSVDYTINSDASIVAPLIFEYVMENVKKSEGKQVKMKAKSHPSSAQYITYG